MQLLVQIYPPAQEIPCRQESSMPTSPHQKQYAPLPVVRGHNLCLIEKTRGPDGPEALT